LPHHHPPFPFFRTRFLIAQGAPAFLLHQAHVRFWSVRFLTISELKTSPIKRIQTMTLQVFVTYTQSPLWVLTPKKEITSLYPETPLKAKASPFSRVLLSGRACEPSGFYLPPSSLPSEFHLISLLSLSARSRRFAQWSVSDLFLLRLNKPPSPGRSLARSHASRLLPPAGRPHPEVCDSTSSVLLRALASSAHRPRSHWVRRPPHQPPFLADRHPSNSCSTSLEAGSRLRQVFSCRRTLLVALADSSR